MRYLGPIQRAFHNTPSTQFQSIPRHRAQASTGPQRYRLRYIQKLRSPPQPRLRPPQKARASSQPGVFFTASARLDHIPHSTAAPFQFPVPLLSISLFPFLSSVFVRALPPCPGAWALAAHLSPLDRSPPTEAQCSLCVLFAPLILTETLVFSIRISAWR